MILLIQNIISIYLYILQSSVFRLTISAPSNLQASSQCYFSSHSTFLPNFILSINSNMRFFAAATFVLAATAAPLEQVENQGSGQVQKRLDPITLTVLTAAAGTAAGWATTEGLNGIKSLIKDTSSWDKVSILFSLRFVNLFALQRFLDFGLSTMRFYLMHR
jgi:hypothetical protein